MKSKNIEDMLKKIYEFENDKKLLEYAFDDVKIPYWIYVRVKLIREIEDRDMNIPETIHRNYYRHNHSIRENILRNPFFSKDKDILFALFDNSIFSKNKEGIIAEHRMYPYINLFKEKTTVLVKYVLEDEFGFQCSYPHWRSDYFLVQCIEKRMQKVRKNKKMSTKRIREFIQYLNDNFPYFIDFKMQKEIFEELKYVMYFQPIAIEMFKKYLKIVQPKLVIVNLASYFSFYAVAMLKACKDNNIVTAEIQHGLIGKCSEAYHCGSAIKENEICKALYPDYFLTRGLYWNDMIDIPTKKYVLGEPKLKDVKKTVKNNNILFIAETDIDYYMELLDYILERIEKNVTLYFRLHPLRHNKAILEKLKKYNKHKNFVIANEKELHYYLNRSKYIISSYSMVTYEALSVGRIVLFLKENGYEKIYEDVHDKVYEFSNGEEFMKIWEGRDKLVPRIYDNFFYSNWRERYCSFLKEVKIVI